VLAVTGVPGRMQRVDAGQPFTVIVDFAHTNDALTRLLGWLRRVATGRVLVVFGCGGERDAGKRPEMGRTAATLADVTFVTSDNPRGEDPERILDDILAGAGGAMKDTERLHRIVDRAEAIRRAIVEARPDDVVVISGKGHETVQVKGDETRPFDDRVVAREALAEAGWQEEPGAEH